MSLVESLLADDASSHAVAGGTVRRLVVVLLVGGTASSAVGAACYSLAWLPGTTGWGMADGWTRWVHTCSMATLSLECGPLGHPWASAAELLAFSVLTLGAALGAVRLVAGKPLGGGGSGRPGICKAVADVLACTGAVIVALSDTLWDLPSLLSHSTSILLLLAAMAVVATALGSFCGHASRAELLVALPHTSDIGASCFLATRALHQHSLRAFGAFSSSAASLPTAPTLLPFTMTVIFLAHYVPMSTWMSHLRHSFLLLHHLVVYFVALVLTGLHAARVAANDSHDSPLDQCSLAVAVFVSASTIAHLVGVCAAQYSDSEPHSSLSSGPRSELMAEASPGSALRLQGEGGAVVDRGAHGAPEDASSWIALYTFWWMFPTLDRATKNKSLETRDLPELPKADKPVFLWQRFRGLWHRRRLRKRTGQNDRVGLLWTVMVMLQPKVFLYSLLHGWLFLGCMFLDPILLHRLLSKAQNDDDSGELGMKVGLVLGLTASMMIRVACMEVCYFASTRCMNNARSVLVHAIYRKALSMGTNGSNGFDVGKLTNLMATDADKLGKSSWVVFFVAQWTWAVISLPAVVYFLYLLVRDAAFVALATLLVTNGFSRWISTKMKPVVKRLQESRDVRGSLVAEMISGIQLIKLHGWEMAWGRKIEASRQVELRHLVWLRILAAGNDFVGALMGLAVPVSIFAWYTLVDKQTLDSATAFTALAWITQMQWSINTLPAMYNLLAYLTPSLDRLDEFFAQEMGDDHTADGKKGDWLLDEATEAAFNPSAGRGGAARAGKDAVAVEVSSADFGYTVEGEEVTAVVKEVNLAVKRGELVVIAGEVGCGKSTLLLGMAAATQPLKGNVVVGGRRAFVAQRPFLLNGTVKENILFGEDEDEERLNEAVRRAALEVDLKALAGGLESVVGESGLQLSGGQRARVGLARALYADAACYFFDDVLSAVDAHTGAFLWKEALLPLLRDGRTIVLVTHQLQYLSREDVSRVILLRNGRIWCDGPWDDIRSRAGTEISRFVDAGEDVKDTGTSGSAVGQNETMGQQGGEEEEEEGDNWVTLAECTRAVWDVLRLMEGRKVDSKLRDTIVSRMHGDDESKEHRRVGLISWSDFSVYLGQFGTRGHLIGLALAATFGAAFTIAGNVWLSVWTDSETPGQQSKNLGIYVGIGVAAAANVAAQTILLTLCGLAASRSLHGALLSRVLKAPMVWFDVTPTGRILNRFLQDLQNIDSYVPDALLNQVTRTLNMFTQLSLVLIFAPFVIASFPVLIVPFYLIYQRVRCAARECRRIESVAHSPVYSHFGDTLRGRETIRAFGAERRFLAQNMSRTVRMSQAKYSLEAVIKWAQALSTQNGCILYLAAGVACVVLNNEGKLTSGQLGLVLLYAAQLQRAMMDYQMGLVDLETQFVSVERLAEYMRVPQEPVEVPASGERARRPVKAISGPDVPPRLVRKCINGVEPDSRGALESWWPTSGEVLVADLRMRYRLHRAAVLDGVSFRVEAGQKVAICGRTGCGKSTLFSALTRLYDTTAGSVVIDGVDVLAQPLGDVRRALRVVTQETLLVADTVRANLTGIPSDSPRHGSISDAAVWAVLRDVGLESFVKTLEGGLSHEVEQGGGNLSSGQRQLLTLARELLPARDGWVLPKLVLCDEVTANVDLATDERVHAVLLGLEATVLMICHRMQHISKFDKVLVMDAGRVVEQGEPNALLAAPNSLLRGLHDRAGLGGGDPVGM